jgi:hypothetical protein|tara:strand:- start:273 stop:377 length:105 start_codon:yes stop_codon:yes gene_type:complete
MLQAMPRVILEVTVVATAMMPKQKLTLEKVSNKD